MRVGIVQEPPAVLDLAESTDRAARHIRAAGRQHLDLVAFPEVWLTCYPAWMFALAGWDEDEARHWYARLVEESPVVAGEDLEPLRTAARQSECTVVIGINERAANGSGTLYNSLVTIGTSGEIVNVHRKLIPTHTERIVWRPSTDATGLRVMQTEHARVGGLICWEHWQPLERQALHSENEQVHVAAWPNAADIELLASRTYAFEGRCFVLAAAQYLTSSDVPPELHRAFRAGIGIDSPHGGQWSVDGAADGVWYNGGSGIAGPDGEWIVEPLRNESGLVTAELDLRRALGYKHDLDVAGHYTRADIFDFTIDRRRKSDATFLDDEHSEAGRETDSYGRSETDDS